MAYSPPENTLRGGRHIRAFFAGRFVRPDPGFERGLAEHLRKTLSREEISELYGRFKSGEGRFDALMRRIALRALVRRMGNGVQVEPDVRFRHPETFDIGSHVFLGASTYLQGRHDGRLRIGNHVWIGPHAYLDARDLAIEDWVGWGPGAAVLGSAHTGRPHRTRIIRTPLEIRPVRVGRGADVGVNAVILPGVRVGRDSIVGAGAVVTEDVPPRTIVAGVPARVLRTRP